MCVLQHKTCQNTTEKCPILRTTIFRFRFVFLWKAKVQLRHKDTNLTREQIAHRSNCPAIAHNHKMTHDWCCIGFLFRSASLNGWSNKCDGERADSVVNFQRVAESFLPKTKTELVCFDSVVAVDTKEGFNCGTLYVEIMEYRASTKCSSKKTGQVLRQHG